MSARAPEQSREGGVSQLGLASLETTFRVVIAGTTLVGAAPPRPGQNPTGRLRRGPDEPCKQMAHFWDSQGKHGRSSGSPEGAGGEGERRSVAQIPVKKARATSTSVMCLYQPVKLRSGSRMMVPSSRPLRTARARFRACSLKPF